MCSNFDDWGGTGIDADGNKTWIVTDLIKTANIFRHDAICIVKPLIAFVDYYVERIRSEFVTKYTVRDRIETDDRSESKRTKAMHQSGTDVTCCIVNSVYSAAIRYNSLSHTCTAVACRAVYRRK